MFVFITFSSVGCPWITIQLFEALALRLDLSMDCISGKMKYFAKQCLPLPFFLYWLPPGYYNVIQLLEAIALHLDSVNGKPCIWEELVSCFLRLFSDNTADYEDCISCTNTHGDEALEVSSKLSSVFFERFTKESWKARCKWWAHHHFSQNAYTSETRSGSAHSSFILLA
jgi:hypothetical protein